VKHKKISKPLVSVAKGKTAVQDRREAVAGIRRGLAQAKKGLGRSVDQVFDELERD
jgi:hypothetical protein